MNDRHEEFCRLLRAYPKWSKYTDLIEYKSETKLFEITIILGGSSIIYVSIFLQACFNIHFVRLVLISKLHIDLTGETVKNEKNIFILPKMRISYKRL